MTSPDKETAPALAPRAAGPTGLARLLTIALVAAVVAAGASYATGRALGPQVPERGSCVPTERYHMAESYRPGAPYVSKVGDGSVEYTGSVRVWPTCLPVAGVSVDVWFTGEDGFYASDTRLQVKTDERGEWVFLTGPLSPEVQPHHIHLKIYGPGIRPMTTAQYPDTHVSGGRYDLVVLEANGEGPAGFLETEPSSGESKEDVEKKKENQR